MSILVEIPHIYWVSYAGMCLDPAYEMHYLARWLGVDTYTLPQPTDANSKWLVTL